MISPSSCSIAGSYVYYLFQILTDYRGGIKGGTHPRRSPPLLYLIMLSFERTAIGLARSQGLTGCSLLCSLYRLTLKIVHSTDTGSLDSRSKVVAIDH